MPEMEAFHPHHHIIRRPPGLRLDPLSRRHLLEEQVELWWFREPRRSLLCYLASVVLILGLGLGGVGLLATATSLSGEWRLGVGTALCLLALAVLLKQLLSSAVQDMNCVHNRQRIEQLKSGGSADPVLMAVVGLALLLCGVVLLYVSTASTWRGGQDQDRDRKDMFLSGLVLMAVGGGMSMAMSGYTALLCLQRRRRREEERQRWMRRRRQRDARRMESRAVRVFSVSGGQGDQARRDASSSSRTSLI